MTHFLSFENILTLRRGDTTYRLYCMRPYTKRPRKCATEGCIPRSRNRQTCTISLITEKQRNSRSYVESRTNVRLCYRVSLSPPGLLMTGKDGLLQIPPVAAYVYCTLFGQDLVREDLERGMGRVSVTGPIVDGGRKVVFC